MRNTILKSLLLSGFVWAMAAANVNAGYAVRLFYDNITGTSVSDLTTNAAFPDGFTFSETIGNTPDANGMYVFVSSINNGDNYGSWTRGYLEAPITGAYTIWIASDDASELWLSTDTTVANKKLIARVPAGSYTGVNQWDKYPGQQNSTNAINFVKGQKYYFEVLHKEGTGGDHIAVGWTLPGGSMQRPLPGYALFPYLSSDTAFTIVQHPQSLSVQEGRPAILFVTVDSGTPNATFQWYKNSVLINGATLSSYVIDKTVLGDNGNYNVKITYPGQAAVFSDLATLTVDQDVTTPTIVSVNTQGYDTLLDVVFSEPVTSASATATANYSFDGGVTVSNATLLSDGVTVRLRTSPLDPTAPHTVTVNGVRDFAGTPNVVANASVAFGASKGSIYDRVYTGITGSTVANLTGASTFPGSPNIITNLPAFETPSTWTDNYGQYVQGWLVPDVTGDYSFAMGVDDQAQLYLSPDSTQANKVQILNETTYTSGPRIYSKTVAQQQTASTATPTYHLVAGQKYYIELLMKEGTGGDSMAVAWQLGGGTIPDNTEPIPGANMIPYIAPTVPLTIGTQPQSQTIVVFRPVTFSISTVGSPSYTRLQWYRNGQPISGANGLTYTINSVAATNDGDVFHATATNLVYTATSSNAVLTVNSDLTPPGLASVNSLDGTVVGLVFNEVADTNTTRVAGNYSVTGATVTGATPSADGRSVMLTLSGTAATQFSVSVSNVKDLAGNTIVAATSIQGNVLNLTIAGIANTLPEQMSVTTPGYLQMVASGADIWGASDQFVLAYITMTGDFDYRLDLHSMSNPNVWAKSGIMVRESIDPASKHIFNATTPQAGNNYSTTQYRPLNGGATSYTATGGTPAATYPNTWLRLKRVGDIFYSFWSADGTNWTVYSTNDTTTGNWTEGPMPQTVLLGIATTSHSATANVTAMVSDFGMLPQVAVAITNQPPATLVRGQNTQLTIPVGATGDPVRYQWRKEGTDIPNATSATFKIDLLQLTDAGTYSVRVFNDTSFVISSNCVVTVSTDNIPPTLARVVGSRSFNTVTVTFSEPVDQAQAENTANYTLDGGLTVLSAVRQANLTNVVLTTSQQTSGTSYTLTINNVTDLAGNKLATDTNGKFTGFVLLSGTATEEIYNNTGSTAGTVAALLAAPNFVAGIPSISAAVNSLDIWGQGGTTINGVLVISAYYGGRFYGWLTPTVSGSYTFGIASDDGGALYLSIDDQPVDKNTVPPIATVSTDGTINTTAYSGQRVWNKYPTNQVSAPIQLQAGQKYFLDAVWENGTGGNGCSVGWTTPNNATMGVIPIAYMSSYVNPDLDSITILQQPTNTTVLQNRTVTFRVAAVGTSDLGTNLTYQWKRDGNNIANATGASYTIARALLTDDQATFTCVATSGGKSLTSDQVTLTVTPDVVAPGISAVGGLAGSGSVVVLFDENVDSATANNPANYTVNGAASTAAVLSSRPNMALLKVASLAGPTVNVTVTGVKDWAGNTLASVSASGPVSSLGSTDVGTRNTNNPAIFSDPLEIGLVLPRGAADFDMVAGGSDIWNNADGCHFLYKQTTGDFDVKVRVASLEGINTWSKAGLMVREDLGGTNRMMDLVVTPLATVGGQNLTAGQYRPVAGAGCFDIITNTVVPRPVGVPYPNAWLRIQRVGDSFFLYRGTNGTDWTSFMTNAPSAPSNAYPATVYVGAVTTSHDNATNRTTFAEFRELTFTGEVLPVTSPTMTFSHQGSTLVLGWPTEAIGFKLQSSPVVPASTWQDVAGSEATNSMTIAIGADNQYYRLKK